MNKLGMPMLMVVLLLLAGGLLWENGWMGDSVFEFEENSHVSTAGVHRIAVESATIDVVFAQGGDDQIRLRLHGRVNEAHRDLYKVEPQVIGGELQIKVLEKDRGWLLGYQGSPDLEITLPKASYERIKAVTKSADVTLAEGTAQRVELHTRTGDVDVERFTAEEWQVETDTGDMRLSQVEGKLALHTAAGDIQLTLREAAPSVEVKTVTGDVDVRLRKVPSNLQLDLKSDSGDLANHLSGLSLLVNDKHRSQGGGPSGGPLLRIHSTKGDIVVQEG